MRGLFVLFLLSCAAPASAQLGSPEKAGCRVVVLNLVAKNLLEGDKDVPGLLTETLANEVSLVSGCQVVTQADVSQMLDFEATKAACNEGADSCLSEIGAALGAERVVGGSLGRLGTEFILNARLMNVKAGTVDARAEQVVPGAVEKLRLGTKNLAHQLYGQPLLTDAPTDAPAQGGVTPAESPGLPVLTLVGGGLAGVGVVTAVIGGVLAGLAEARLSNPAEQKKDDAIGEGQVAVVVTSVGVTVAAVGGGLLIASMLSE